MSLVLAIEPDAAQADALRAVVDTIAGTRLEIVSSKDDAIHALGSELPDLMLVSALLAPRDEEEVIAHLRFLDGAAHLQTLTIPPLGQPAEPARPQSFLGRWKRQAAQQASGCDPAAFAEQINAYLTWAAELRKDASAPAASAPAAQLREPPASPAPLVSEPVDEEAPVPEAAHPIEDTPPGEPQLAAALEIEEETVTPSRCPVYQAPLPEPSLLTIGDDDEPVFVIEGEPETWSPSFTEPADRPGAESWMPERVSEPVAATPDVATPVPAVPAPADLVAETVASFQAEAGAALALEIERVRTEASQRHAEELTRWQAEAEALRDAAVDQARSAAEAEARGTLSQELARAREQAEQAFADALQRVRDEAAETLKAEIGRVHDAAEQRRQDDLARVAQEAAARLETSIVRVRQEAAEVRDETTETLKAEIGRARDEAEERRQRDLARVEEAAATRLETTIVRVRQEAEEARAAEQFEAEVRAEEIRRRAAEEARAAAEAAANATLHAEIARVRADTEAHLASEVLRLRVESEQRRAAELEAIRTQLAEVRDAAARQVRVVRPQPRLDAPRVAHESRVVRELPMETADPTWAPPPLLRARQELMSAEPAPSRDYYELWNGQRPRTPDPRPAWAAPQAPVPARSRWMLPIAASLVLVAAGGLSVNTTSLALGSRLSAMGSRITAMMEPVQPAPVPEPVAAPVRKPRKAPRVPAIAAPTAAAVPTTGETTAPKSGWLAIFSRIPLDIVLDGHRIGSTEDGQLLVSAGRHEVTLVNARFNFRRTETFDVQATFVTSHTVTLPMGTVRVTAPAGTEIWVEGERVGEAPLADLPVAIGTRDIMGRHPDFGELHQVVEVRADEPSTAMFGLP